MQSIDHLTFCCSRVSKEKYDLDVNAVECTDTTQGETLIRELCEAGYGLIINLEAGISGNMYTVSKQTRKRVLDACKEYGYDFSNRSLYLSNNQNGAICLVLYKRTGAVVSDTPFFSSLIEGVGNVCRRNHYKLNIVYIYENNDLREQLLSLNASGSVGIIFLATELNGLGTGKESISI